MGCRPLLGGMTVSVFLRDYWQKKPLLVRGAMMDVGPALDRRALFQLACDEEVESRLIEQRAGGWTLEQGPFRRSRFKSLPQSDWTLLVQSANHHIPHIDRLLRQFDFIPAARLDDLMISFAPAGGSVGPHVDAYDVFLLQVAGAKRWQLSSCYDPALRQDAPHKVLLHFDAEVTWVLEHGDMLYLPPGYAHYGVALEEGMTYSVGFRAPSVHELLTQFLVYLQDRVCADGMYTDPDLRYQSSPACIPSDMIDQVASILTQICWQRSTVASFLGHYLTEPKPHIFYRAPDNPLDEDRFAARFRAEGIALDPRSQVLYSGNEFYCNGEKLLVEAADVTIWQQFANCRALDGGLVTSSTLKLLYKGYLSGYWRFAKIVS